MSSDRFLYHLKDLQFEYVSEFLFQATEKRFKNMPNNEKFNRQDRYEMILLINTLQNEWNLSTIEDCSKIERLIKTEMPSNINTQIEVADWLVLNWNNESLITKTA